MNLFISDRKLSIIWIFLAIIIHLSDSSSDLNLSDDNNEQIHNHQYSWRSERHHQSPGAHNQRWFYNNHNINGEPSAMANLGHFFDTAFNGRFPFDSKFSGPPLTPFPGIPPIPRPPPLPSNSYQNRAPEFKYWHKSYDRNHYNNERPYHYGSQNSHSKVKQWSYSHKSGHSYHWSSDNGVDHNKNWKWDESMKRPNIWDNKFPHSSQSYPFSHRSTVPNVDQIVDNLMNDHFVKDNGFVKEHKFSWNIVENKPYDNQFNHFSWQLS